MKICNFQVNLKKKMLHQNPLSSFLISLYFFLKTRSHTFLCSFVRRDDKGEEKCWGGGNEESRRQRKMGKKGGKEEEEEKMKNKKKEAEEFPCALSLQRVDVITLIEDKHSQVNL